MPEPHVDKLEETGPDEDATDVAFEGIEALRHNVVEVQRSLSHLLIL